MPSSATARAKFHRSSTFVLRGLMLNRRAWPNFVSTLLEPVILLIALGMGMGRLIGEITVDGRIMSYEQFIAPAMLATAAVSGVVNETTYSFYAKLTQRLYEGYLATPLTIGELAAGETAWALLCGGVYSSAFLVSMVALGLAPSWWILLALPGAALISLAFAAVSMAATTFMRRWEDFEHVSIWMFLMTMCSGTVFPIETYPGWGQVVVRLTPLYQGVELLRDLSAGRLTPGTAGHVCYLLAMSVAGFMLARRRLSRLLAN
ncbi:ABC transporter permease [Streptomyces sp. NPDC058335]|uniref:ABC transporter permease n=1 Tax=Streptomyces sp. NPDC058335 TaxID=3346451 RepID=UPI0036597540